MTAPYARAAARHQLDLSAPPPGPGFKQRTADTNRRKRRAIVKAIGARQFKKLYRGVPA